MEFAQLACHSGGMMTDPLSTWLGFLASPAAPRTAMSPLELDGYLTGIAVAPEPVMPSHWIGGLWGRDEPIFASADQMQLIIGAVMEHYNDLVAAIDDGFKSLEAKQICDFRPLFLAATDKPKHDTVRTWVGGFGKAMALTPEAWASLIEDERMRRLIAPFVGFMDINAEELLEQDDDIDELLDDSAAAIPRVIVALRKLAQMRYARTRNQRPAKIGRNDPCPCGSGRKYKRCCATH